MTMVLFLPAPRHSVKAEPFTSVLGCDELSWTSESTGPSHCAPPSISVSPGLQLAVVEIPAAGPPTLTSLNLVTICLDTNSDGRLDSSWSICLLTIFLTCFFSFLSSLAVVATSATAVPARAATSARTRAAELRSAGSTGTRLTLLNAFELVCHDVPVALPMSAQRLVAFLALHNRLLLRSFVAGSLWLDTPEERAHANLRSGGCIAATGISSRSEASSSS